MRKPTAVRVFILFAALSVAFLLGADAPRAITISDALNWKSIATSALSENGQWFAYRSSPNEGDSEVVVRNIADGKEQRFPGGELGEGGGFGASDMVFSKDSRWVAFKAYETRKDARRMKKEKKAPSTKAVLVELATGKKTEFEKIRNFAFSGELATWFAVHRAPAGGAPAPPAGPPAPGGAPAPDRPMGADLILHELATGNELSIGNVSEFACNKPGDWCAWIIDAADKAGNGVQARNMVSGAVLPLDSGKANYKSLRWTEKGEALTALKGVEDKDFEDKLYTVLGFKDFASGRPSRAMFDPKTEKSFPAGMSASGNRPPEWTEDLKSILFGISEVKANKKNDKKGAPPKEGEAKDAPAARPTDTDEPEKADLVIWHWQDRRLQSMQQVQESMDKNFSYAAVFHTEGNRFVRLADEELRDVSVPRPHRWGLGTDLRSHERMGNLDGRRYRDIYLVDLQTGQRKLALSKSRWSAGMSPDASHLLYYNDGHYYTYEAATGKSYNITEKVPAVFHDTEDDHNVVKPPTQPMGWSKDSQFVLLTDNWDIWQVPAHGGKAVNLTGNGKKDGIRYRQRFVFDPEELGADLTQPQYVSAYGERNKKAGIALLAPGKPGAQMLVWEDAAFRGIQKARKADVFVYRRESTTEPADFFSTGADLKSPQRLTDQRPQLAGLALSSGVRLVDYTSAKGDNLQAALFLPANYEPGKKYPTLVYIYEKMSQSANTFDNPSARGFNRTVYTSNGYAVLMPDIVYKVNDPGMSSVWCVLPALKAAVDTGVVDPAKVGLHGHSWGGYQTSFLVTQTDAFRAAIAGAPLTNLVSMYSLIYWNSGSTNQPIFESSQGRFQGGYWDNLEAYMRNSPVYHARNVKTPLMILHNDKDGAVDFTQGIEYFNTLRRLDKPVVMLQYKGENHGLRQPGNLKDYAVRMREFFDHHLLGKPAPAWLEQGVPHLKLKDHLDDRAKEISEQAKPAAAAKPPSTQ